MRHKKHMEERINNGKPIQCFKVVIPEDQMSPLWYANRSTMPAYYSLHEKYRYEENQIYWEPRWLEDLGVYDPYIMFGFRTYRYSTTAFQLKFDDERCIVVEFAIPTGARFFYNPVTKEYISNQLECVGYYPIYKSLWDSLTYPFVKTTHYFSGLRAVPLRELTNG